MALSKKDIDWLVADTVAQIRALSVRNTPAIRAVRQELSAKVRKESAKDVVALGFALYEAGPRWVGYEVIRKHRAAFASLRLRDVEALGKGVHSWDTVDAFGCIIAGPALLNDQISITDVAKWARSTDLWWRRTALVATTVLNKKTAGGAGDPERTLRIASLLIDDREDMIVKAMSWALRALVAAKPAAAKKFLNQNRDRLAARVVRETSHKLKHGVKSRRRNA